MVTVKADLIGTDAEDAATVWSVDEAGAGKTWIDLDAHLLRNRAKPRGDLREGDDVSAELAQLGWLGKAERGVLGEETQGDGGGGLLEGVIVAGVPFWKKLIEGAGLDDSAGENV